MLMYESKKKLILIIQEHRVLQQEIKASIKGTIGSITIST